MIKQQCTAVYSGKQCQLDDQHAGHHSRQLDSGQRLDWWGSGAAASNQQCEHIELRKWCDGEGLVRWFCVEPKCDFELDAASRRLRAALRRLIGAVDCIEWDCLAGKQYGRLDDARSAARALLSGNSSAPEACTCLTVSDADGQRVYADPNCPEHKHSTHETSREPAAYLVLEPDGWRYLASTRAAAEHIIQLRGGKLVPLFEGYTQETATDPPQSA